MLDFKNEENQLEKDMHWAAESGSRVLSEARKSARKARDQVKALQADLGVLRTRRDYLLGVIEGRIRPPAVDIPKEEAEDFMTKLRLRIKGVRGIAIERAKEEIVSVEDDIEKVENRIENAEAAIMPSERRMSEAENAFSELTDSLRRQRSLLRKGSQMYGEITVMTDVFGWYNPYDLARKCFEEVEIARGKVAAKSFSARKLKTEIEGLEQKAEDLKKELRSVLGEAYDASLMHIVFKGGRSPRGKRFLQNELTVGDVESLDLMNKLAHSKIVARKADRLSSVLWNHRNFILESLLRMGHVCELKLYDLRLLELARGAERVARRSLAGKTELFHTIISAAENCGRLDQAVLDYRKQAEETAKTMQRARVIVGGTGSNL